MLLVTMLAVLVTTLTTVNGQSLAGMRSLLSGDAPKSYFRKYELTSQIPKSQQSVNIDIQKTSKQLQGLKNEEFILLQDLEQTKKDINQALTKLKSKAKTDKVRGNAASKTNIQRDIQRVGQLVWDVDNLIKDGQSFAGMQSLSAVNDPTPIAAPIPPMEDLYPPFDDPIPPNGTPLLGLAELEASASKTLDGLVLLRQSTSTSDTNAIDHDKSLIGLTELEASASKTLNGLALLRQSTSQSGANAIDESFPGLTELEASFFVLLVASASTTKHGLTALRKSQSQPDANEIDGASLPRLAALEASASKTKDGLTALRESELATTKSYLKHYSQIPKNQYSDINIGKTHSYLLQLEKQQLLSLNALLATKAECKTVESTLKRMKQKAKKSQQMHYENEINKIKNSIMSKIDNLIEKIGETQQSGDENNVDNTPVDNNQPAQNKQVDKLPASKKKAISYLQTETDAISGEKAINWEKTQAQLKLIEEYWIVNGLTQELKDNLISTEYDSNKQINKIAKKQKKVEQKDPALYQRYQNDINKVNDDILDIVGKMLKDPTGENARKATYVSKKTRSYVEIQIHPKSGAQIINWEKTQAQLKVVKRIWSVFGLTKKIKDKLKLTKDDCKTQMKKIAKKQDKVQYGGISYKAYQFDIKKIKDEILQDVVKMLKNPTGETASIPSNDDTAVEGEQANDDTAVEDDTAVQDEQDDELTSEAITDDELSTDELTNDKVITESTTDGEQRINSNYAENKPAAAPKKSAQQQPVSSLPNDTNSKNKLSTGAIVAIVVGSVVGGGLVIGALLFYCRQRLIF